MMEQAYVLEVHDIKKTFGGIQALKGVGFNLKAGEVLGLVGENGAGKSTLMRIICGIIQPDGDSGRIMLEGEDVKLTSPHKAQELGIAMIPQELVLIQELTVAENIFLGREKTSPLGLLQKDAMYAETRKILQDLHCAHIDPLTPVKFCSKADQQLIAIARRLIQGGKIFIMDEPTAALTERETASLFTIIREKLCKAGLSVIFISHRLEEVVEICDRITVLRDGQKIITLQERDQKNKNTLIYHMIGESVKEEYPKIFVEKGEEVLRVEQLQIKTNQGEMVRDITFNIHEGQVVGITGLVGVGKTELGQTLIGLKQLYGGKIFFKHQETAIHSPMNAIRHGIGYVSEDRRGEGLILGLESIPNMTINSLHKISTYHFILNTAKERKLASEFSKRLGMRDQYLDLEARQLSGGNQQKLVIIRQIISESRLVIFDEPTKGIDVGAKSEIARIIGELSQQKKAILLLSSEPREILGLSDVICILTKDGFRGPFERSELTYEKLMAIELGGVINA